VRRRLRMAEWLWTLQLVAESHALLQDGVSAETRLRRGDAAHVAMTLERGLRALAHLHW